MCALRWMASCEGVSHSLPQNLQLWGTWWAGGSVEKGERSGASPGAAAPAWVMYRRDMACAISPRATPLR